MNRLKIWVWMSLGGFAQWWIVHDFVSEKIDAFTAPVWFGGVALLADWILERAKKGEQA